MHEQEALGLDVLVHCPGGSPKSQFKRADASGATVAVIIGEDEAANGTATLKPLRDRQLSQATVLIGELPDAVTEMILGDMDIDPSVDDAGNGAAPTPTHH